MNQLSLAAQRRLVHHQIERQCRYTSQRIAVQTGEERITYRQLNRLSTRLALHLRRFAKQTGKPIGVLLNPGTDYVVSVLAILKSGGCCVPLSPDESEDQIFGAIDAIRPRLVVTCRRNQWRLPATGIRTVLVGNQESTMRDLVSDSAWVYQSETARAFLLREPGLNAASEPTLVRFDEIQSLLKDAEYRTNFCPHDSLLALAPVTSKVSIAETLLPLTVGGRVLVASKAESDRGQLLFENGAADRPPIVLSSRAGFTTR